MKTRLNPFCVSFDDLPTARNDVSVITNKSYHIVVEINSSSKPLRDELHALFLSFLFLISKNLINKLNLHYPFLHVVSLMLP